MHGGHVVFHRGTGLLGLGRPFRHAFDRIFDQSLDFLGGLRALLCQAAHLAGDDREALAGLARTRGFHRSVQCQDVGLERDAFDDADDVRDLARTVRNAVHGVDHLAHRHAAATRDVHAAGGQLIGLAGVVGVLTHRRGQLFHAGSRLLQRGRLPFRTTRQFLVAAGDMHGRVRGALDAPVDVLCNADQALAHDFQRKLQAAHFIVRIRHDLRGQVAGGDLARHVGGIHHRIQQRPRQAPAHAENGDHAQCNDAAAEAGAQGIQRGPVSMQPVGARARDDAARQQRMAQHAATHAALEGKRYEIQTAPPARAHGAAAVDAHAARRAFADAGVQLLGHLHLLVRRTHAHRRIRDDFAVFDNRRGVGQHPVVAPILAPVLDESQPRFARFQRIPQIRIGFGRHVGVAHDVVRLADQFFAGEAADFDERRVRVDDAALGIGARDQVLIFTQLGFHVMDG
ncbi:hypothetical protein G6F22_013523 [Rhizopus arrhizus]|nr:hypothetical protein G6F22_013523 [Rhizopus arrhizus]